MAGSGTISVRLTVTLAAAAALVGLSPMPAASAGTATATVGVNVRSGPGTSYRIVAGLDRGDRISTIGSATKGWVRIRLGSGTGWVSARYLSPADSGPVATAAATGGVKVTTATVNVRTGPGLRYRVVTTLAEGRRVGVTGRLSRGFAQVIVHGHRRWISGRYLADPLPTMPAMPAALPSSTKGAVALAFAKTQLGKPYRFGATGPNAYDCSGLALVAWRQAGVSLPRTTYQQFKVGYRVSKSELRPGDLVFFYGPNPSHVALYVGNGTVIHAPRPGKRVSYARLSSMPWAGAVRPGF